MSDSKTIRIYVNNAGGETVVGARISFKFDGAPIGEVTSSRGGATIDVPAGVTKVHVSASHIGQAQEVELAPDAGSYTFALAVPTSAMSMRILAIVLGVLLIGVGIATVMMVRCPTK